MTKATEIKLEDDRENAKNGFRDRRRGMKLVAARKSLGKAGSFNIGVAENMFSPRVAMVDRSGFEHSDERMPAVETNHHSNYGPLPDTIRTVAKVGILIVACTLGFLIGRRRD